MKIIGFFIRQSMLLNLLTILVCGLGIWKMWQMNKEAFPSVDFDVVSVATRYPGASPKEVELYVTNPIEDEIKQVSGLNRTESTSIESLSLIVVYLDPDLSQAQKVKAGSDIQKAVDRVTDLPDDLPNPPSVDSVDSGDMPVLEVALTGDLPYAELYEHAEKLVELIEDSDDVKEVDIRGHRKREYWVELNQDKLNKFNIGLSQIIASLAVRNLDLPGGVLKTEAGDLLVRTIGELKTAAEMANIVVRTNDAGIHVRLSDLGEVRATFEEEKYIFRTNGTPSINLNVNKKASGDIIDLVESVKRVTNEYALRHPGLKASFINDISVFVKNRLGVLKNNGVLGIILVLVILLIFLSKGIAVVTAIGMPVALLACLMVMGYTGTTINLISMFGLVIVLGMLVDDAIIVAENIWQHYESGAPPLEAAIRGASEVFWPVTATILTTIAAFSPLLMISGIFGKFISIMPKVVIFALIASLLEAMLVLPSHAHDALRIADRKHKRKSALKKSGRAIKDFKDTLMGRAAEAYCGVLRFVLQLRYLFFGMIGLSLAGSLYLAKTKMELVLFPSEGIEAFFVRLDQPISTSLQETSAKLKIMEKFLAELPPDEIRDFVTDVGIQQDDPNDPFSKRSSNVAQIKVFLTPEKDRKRLADQIIEDLRSQMTPRLKELGFTKLTFGKIRTGPPVGKPVAIRVRGDHLNQLSEAANSVKTQLTTLSGVSDVQENFGEGKNEFQVHVDEAKASRALLSVRDVALHVRAAIEGQIASFVRNSGDRIAVRVRYPKEQRRQTSDLTASRIVNGAGYMVKLSSVATFSQEKGLNAILHYNFRRTVTVSAAIDESLTSSTKVNALMASHLADLHERFPEVTFEAGGEFEDTDESMRSLKEAFLVALGLIFLILATQFKSLTQPFVIMAAIPFGVVGVIIAFYLHGLPLSFFGMIGTIGLSGVVVNDSIVLVDFINKARLRGLSTMQACLYAGKRRFRAVWLTTLTTVFGLLPLVYGIGGHDMFLKPAALALSYGLVFGTILVLFFVPSAYMIRHDLANLLGMLVGRKRVSVYEQGEVSRGDLDSLPGLES